MGCAPQSSLPFTAEVDDPEYRRGKELLRMGREPEALAQFLKVVDQRGGAAAESHLEVGIIFQKHIKDPVAAIYHYRRYRELRPNTEQSRLVLQSIESCIREFARTLPAQPIDNQIDRTDMMDAIDKLQRENLGLKEQLAAARAALLDASRLPPGTSGAAFSLSGPDAGTGVSEPSQDGFVVDNPVQPIPKRAPAPDYAVPVGVNPVPVTPLPTTSRPPVPPPPTAASATASSATVRRHVVAKGDTLMSISLRHYGNRGRWREIYAANRDQLPNETALRIGMELRLP
jgi:tetratricopeptide (TPR) repeat protein